MAKLGDYPGLDDMLPDGTILSIMPVQASTEVNALGEVTAEASALGGLDPIGASGTDPFAVQAGFLDRERGQDAGGATGQSHPAASSFLPSFEPTVGLDSPDSYSGGGYGDWDAEQVSSAQTIARVGQELGASDRDIQIALMAAIVESGLRNVHYGDRDSLGLFQQRDAWGSAAERTDPAEAAKMFFLGGQGGQEGLLDIKDRDSRPMGEVAQDVQVSAFPERYAEHESDAANILAAVKAPARSTTRRHYRGKNPYDVTERDGEVVDNMTSAALDAAVDEFGSDLRIMQGGHSHYEASGNTHAGLGVVDLDVPNGDWEGAMTALRKIGFAAWVRNVPGYSSAGDGAHIHAVLIGNEALSPEAATQVQSYLNNDNGLSGSTPDDGPRQFVNNRFVWGRAKNDKREDGREMWRTRIVENAQRFIGSPFRWGGEDYEGVDNEGFIRAAYKTLGIDVPEMADDITKLADPVPLAEAKPGDLITWDNDGLMDHPQLGIYIGNGQFIDGGVPGRVVQLNDIGSAALGAVSIPMQQVIESVRSKPKPLNRPAPGEPFNTAPVQTSQVRPGTSVVEPHASIPAPAPAKPKPAADGPLQETTFGQKPKIG